jgi:hypothetical protein
MVAASFSAFWRFSSLCFNLTARASARLLLSARSPGKIAADKYYDEIMVYMQQQNKTIIPSSFLV